MNGKEITYQIGSLKAIGKVPGLSGDVLFDEDMMKVFVDTNEEKVITFYLHVSTDDAKMVIGPCTLKMVCGMNSKPSLAPGISFMETQFVE